VTRRKLSVDSRVKIMGICSAEHLARAQSMKGYTKSLCRHISKKQELEAGDTDKRKKTKAWWLIYVPA
jgi:hypothetical protein